MKMLHLRNLFLLLLTFLFVMNSNSQQPVKNYEKEWKKVEDLGQKALPKSALAEVKKIYSLAKKEKQEAQVIKSLVYITELQSMTREENETLSIAEMEKELNQAAEPGNSILKSIMAGMYWNYYQQHRWQMMNRTQTAQFNKTDIATWGAADFHKRISELYLQSIRNTKQLQQTKLEAYDAIIIKGNMRHLRPTLYDLLAQQALSYFENDERDLDKPAYAFEIDQASAFDPAADFIHRKFVTNDSLSLQHKALLIYQELISFHLGDPKPDALVDADIQRIQFVKENSTHPDKELLYYNAINHIARQYEELPAASQAWYLLAEYYNEQANGYKPYGDTTHRFDRLKAREICEKLQLQKDSSEGKINAWNLLQALNSRSFEFSVEKVNSPGLAFRSLVTYKNIGGLYFRLIRADEKLKTALENQYDEKYWPALIKASPLKSWQQPLPATHDLQEHKVEIKLEGLSSGEYLLFASSDENFSSRKSLLGARYFFVSAISYVNNDNDYFVLHRETGQPLAGATVQVWEQKYDYKQSRYIKEKGKLFTTDAHGFFKMDKPKTADNSYRNYSFLLDIKHNNDRLFLNDYQHDYYYYQGSGEQENKDITSIYLFTDRAIYRPGQTVYFKGIVLSRNTTEKKAAVVKSFPAILFLRDANYKDIDSLNVLTNEFGSFNGKFQLPQGGLNGQFSIYTKEKDGMAGFRVEEYKRPKFYVDYEPVKGTYKVNDKITVTGIAKAYAGNNIDGATVKYRVVRQPRFLYPWLFWRWWQPPTESMEIAHGEAKTGTDGKFTVEFTAIPDLKIEKKFEPVFDYTVYADITDINGETRSGEKSVSVSYKALLLLSNIPSTLPADSLKTLSIRTENMNGEFEPAAVKVSISKLREEKRLIRDRYWDRPDQFVMNKDEYVTAFPYDEYDNETDLKSWEKEAGILNKADSLKEGSVFGVQDTKFTAGFYIIEITAAGNNGEEVKDVKYIELFDEKNRQLNRPQYLWTGNPKTTAEPGEKASIELGTAAENLFVVHQINKESSVGNRPASPQGGQAEGYHFLTLNNEKKLFEFPATEADRGGYGAGWIFVKNNRFYQRSIAINVRWSNKDLKIEYASYRDKTLPGSEEKWKLKITGYKNEKVAAELLGSMYDASLDQFVPHTWNRPFIWRYSNYRINWDADNCFTLINSNQKPISEQGNKSVNKQFDQLLSARNNENGLYFRGAANKYKLISPSVAYVAISDTKIEYDANSDGGRLMRLPKPVFNSLEEAVEAKKRGVILPDEDEDGIPDQFDTENSNKPTGDVKVRKKFSETAFFLPELRTDSTGAIEFSFTLPEALTKWKFMALAHTREAAFGYSTKEIVTQKELMVQPNAPRFLREGDKMEFSSKIVNLADKELTGTAELQLFDATTNQPVDGWFRNAFPTQYFTVGAGQSEAVKFPVEVPYLFNKALVWRIVARAGNYSDGEENSMPVLTNRMLVTESLPLNMKGSGSKNFSFEKLRNSGSSESLQQHALTVEYTSNPAWYAVQALPYLMEYPYECAEQTWNRYFANSLAAYISSSSPKIRQVFEQWKIKDTAALLGNLEKNQELKAVLLEETPWVLEAKSEAQQKKNIALLFDMVKMSEQLSSSFEKLKAMQSPNGGFVWFTGGPDDRYITQYIVTGIGHLKKLKGIAAGQEAHLKSILTLAIPYLDRKIKEDYAALLKNKVNLKTYLPGYTEIQYLYMRSFFPDYEIAKASQTAYSYFRGRARAGWTKESKYMQGMIALALSRTGDKTTPIAILKSLKETSINHEELGRYWKQQSWGWFWYQMPVETQSLLIEAFQEAGKDNTTVDELKTWLLKNKQTNSWKTTKATAEACYALLIQGTDWLSNEPAVEIKLGNTIIKSADAEAGTGYFKKTIEGQKVNVDMGNIVVSVAPLSTSQPANQSTNWGSVYWQYFEDLDKITTAETPLKLSKKLFVEANSDRGPVITPVNEGDVVKVGDKIKVRVELRVDRDMEYVHMKDMRAAALEPVNVLSSYKWQGGLGYYESTKDASTNFFFSYLRKGTYVFEYELFATHAGNFSNGVTSIQCMYAPEFSAHSEGIRINIE